MATPDFNQLCNDFRQFRAILGKALTSPDSSGAKQQLESLTTQLDEAFAELHDAYPRANADLDAQIAATRASVAKTGTEVAAMKDQLSAAVAAAASAQLPAAPADTIDPELGTRLRSELLERFGIRADQASAEKTLDKEIWEDWNWQDWSRN